MGRLRDALAAGEDHPSRLCQCGDDCRRRHDAYCADCEMSQVLRLLRAGEPMSILNKTKKLSTVRNGSIAWNTPRGLPRYAYAIFIK